MAVLGAVSGGLVDVYAMNANGGFGAKVAASIPVNGGSFQIPQLQGNGPWVFVLHGGAYTDEATGALANLGSNAFMSAAVKGQQAIAITPISHAAVMLAQKLVQIGYAPAQAVDAARAQFLRWIGVDPFADMPFDTSAQPPAVNPNVPSDGYRLNHALLVGGLSFLAANDPAMTAFANANPADVQAALAANLSNLNLDGRDVFGHAINVPLPNGAQPLPNLVASGGLGLLAAQAQSFLQCWTGSATAQLDAYLWHTLQAGPGGVAVYPTSPPPLGSLSVSAATSGGEAPMATITPESATTSATFGFIVTYRMGDVKLVADSSGYASLEISHGHPAFQRVQTWRTHILGGAPVVVDQGRRTVTFNNVRVRRICAPGNTCRYGDLVLNGTLRF
ncbi:MAG: hypothetical protein D6771_00490 [Zetaproteobacteria bacterium]|nr:MAG: hypothetical protein D6771_00490 [Zetaproteobacteria bacterium]